MAIRNITRILKINTIMVLSFCLIYSCTPSNKRKGKVLDSFELSPYKSTIHSDTIAPLTLDQELAFDALNSIQIKTEEGHFYSTFAGIYHNCLPKTYFFIVSRSELQSAMEALLSKYGMGISAEESRTLINQAVMAQDKYEIELCSGDSFVRKYKRIPKKGVWILRSVLGRRDIVLIW